jgi:tetratricopeptide (TPR) repeat protein
VLEARGEYVQAQGNYEQALEMQRRLYPADGYLPGHKDVAVSLHNLGAVLKARGEYVRAQGYFEQALEMHRRLYPADRFPSGHPDLAASLNGLGWVLEARGEYARAVQTYDEALQASRVAPEDIPFEHVERAALALQPLPRTFTVLSNKGRALQQQFPEQPSSQQLRACEQTYALAGAIQERLRGEVLQQEESKLQHGEKAADLLPQRIGLLQRLFAFEGDPRDLRTAFAAAEQGRARVFIESLGAAHAGRLAGLYFTRP